MLVRQSDRLLHQLGVPHILLKLDLARTFDSLSRPFLFEVLRQYGFRDKFLEWVGILLSSANTKVLLNGSPGPPIWHRQGDSMSPQLFVLAVDTLSRLFKRATELGVIRQLHPTRSIPSSRCMRMTWSYSAILCQSSTRRYRGREGNPVALWPGIWATRQFRQEHCYAHQMQRQHNEAHR